MRLTLRTMLAYMDDILERADAQDVGKKIEESEFATTLMHRMRDVTRRLRVGAPKLHGRGLGLDANTVAEYLDNTLLSERVADFEKVCLESDVHLAEVTAAHQILALVLGEPAEVEAASRQRMYGLPAEAEAAPRHGVAAKKSDGAVLHRRRKKKRRKVEVPDYLREPVEPEPRSRRPVLALAALLVIGAVAAGGYVWMKNHPGEIALLGGGGADNADRVQPQTDGVSSTATDEQTNVAGGSHEGAGAAGGAAAQDDAESGAAPDRSDQDPAPDSGTSGNDDAGQSDGLSSKPAATAAAKVRKSAPAAAHNKGMSTDADDSQDTADEPPPETVPATNRNPKRAARSTGKNRAAQSDASDDENSGPPAPAGDGVGRLISEHEVLVRQAGKQVRRVPGRGTVYAGDTLTALPAYRPSVVLASGITVQLYGGARATLAALDADGVAEIHLDAGRLVLLSAARPEMRVRLQAGDQAGLVTFGQEDAVLAIEVAHQVVDGTDPEAEPAPPLVDLYVASGEIAWQDEQGRMQSVRGKSHWPLGRGEPSGGKKAEDLPVWIEENDLTPIERRAAASVEDFLHADKPVVPALVELVAHRRPENSVLAVQCLALIGQFESLVPLLGDPSRRRLDNTDIVSLRAAVARGPETAARVRAAFESVRGQKQGDELYRMLWGYSPDQLEEGGAAQLVERLSDEALDYRVLSFWNLHHITGLGYFYKPESTEVQRRTPVQKWQQKLKAGLIVPKADGAGAPSNGARTTK